MKEKYSDQSGASSGNTTDAGNSGKSRNSLSIDQRFEILKNARRRIVLEYLSTADGEVKLDDLADYVTAVENDTEVDAITSSERKRAYVGLYQFHLPKMSKMGVINYDQDRGDISLTAAGEQLYQEHTSSAHQEQRWWRAYLSLGGLGAVAVFGTVLSQAWLVATVLFAVQTVLVLLLSLYYM